jgi:hypothetical protein
MSKPTGRAASDGVSVYIASGAATDFAAAAAEFEASCEPQALSRANILHTIRCFIFSLVFFAIVKCDGIFIVSPIFGNWTHFYLNNVICWHCLQF